VLSIVFGVNFEKILENIFLIPIDNNTHCVVEYQQVNNAEVQAKLVELRQKGWTLANIAREIGQAARTVESWNQGRRSPANLQSVLASLDKVDKIKRIPKKKIYVEGSRRKPME
jgi:DNA-binding transcriptional regulator YiaG